jgi:cytoskeletal protein CcmA (bactofilin family)
MLQEDQASADPVVEEASAAEERKRTTHLPLPTPPPPVANASTLQKMKEKGVYQQQYFKDAQCFDCAHKFKVGRSSRSTTCPQCGGYISLEDVEITLASTQAIRTRGDVTIRKNGHVAARSIQCREFRCFGKVEANVSCTGDAVFRASGTLIGEIHCSRFVVEKGSDLVLMNPVYADEMEIHAKVTGQLFSRRQIFIGGNGAVNGDVTARSVSIEPGGELNGAMNILRSDPQFPGPKL